MTRLTAATQVKVVAWLLLLFGVANLFCGMLAGGALGRDVAVGSDRQVAFGPALLLSGILGAFAWRRNVRFDNRPLGLVALSAFGVIGLVCFRPINPYTALMLYGGVVYLSPGGRAAFRR